MRARYQPYETYVDSIVEWVGETPSSWGVIPVKRWLSESPCYGVLKPDKYEGVDAVPVIRIMDVNADGTVASVENLDAISPSLSIEYRRTLIKAGDLVISVVGTLGRSFICTDSLVGMNLSRALARLQVCSPVTAKYLQYVIGSKVFEDYVGVTCTGAAQKVLNMEDVSNWSVPSPSEAEQRTIAAFLDYETARIDALIAKQQRLIELLKEKRQAVISRAVTKGLNPDAPMKDSGVEWLGEVPEHWKVGRYKFCASRVVVGIAEAATHAYADTGVPIIRSTNITEEGIRQSDILFLEEAFAVRNFSKIIYANDIVTVRTGYPGVSAVVPESLDRSQCFTNLIATPMQNHDSEFLSEYLNSHAGKSYFSLLAWGSAQLNISVPILQNIPIAWPELEEQKNIVSYIKAQRSKFTSLIAKANASVGFLSERRTALISAAVTGKIDLRGWKPPVGTKTEIVEQEAVA